MEEENIPEERDLNWWQSLIAMGIIIILCMAMGELLVGHLDMVSRII